MSPKDKEILNRIYDKHYGKGSKAKKENAKITKVVKEKKAEKQAKQTKVSPPVAPGEAITTGVDIVEQAPKAGTRAALMAEAQAKGIKYFRILTKEELTEVLSHSEINDSASKAYIQGITDKAKARWKKGWGNKGEKVGSVPERTAA